MNEVGFRSGRWIGALDHSYGETGIPAPVFRKEFELDTVPENARLRLAVGGLYELRINGAAPDDRVLAPPPSQFDRHYFYAEYEVAALLKQGRNRVEILLGNGWYNCATATIWKTECSPWRDMVKFCCELVDGADQLLLKSDLSWRWSATPTIFNELRNGETFDARLTEAPAVWQTCFIVAPPGGEPLPDLARPCRICRWFEPVAHWRISAYESVYDFGVNLSGVAELTVTGPAGGEVIVDYAEFQRANHDIENGYFERFIVSDKFQRDRYILRGGDKPETWHARFTYHGFRYVRLLILNPNVSVRSIRAGFIHTDLGAAGELETSDPTLNALQKMTVQSYLSNFVGIPTDCPHREKNGWTGDAQLAMETGCWNFQVRNECAQFLQTVLDTQRPSGQLAAVAPSGGFGYNYWSGPAWDHIIFEYPYELYRFYGDAGPLARHYGNLARYLDFCRTMEDDAHLLNFGLGDWCHYDAERITPVRFTSSAYYYRALQLMAQFADVLGKAGDAAEYRKYAVVVGAAVRSIFTGRDDWTEAGMALAFGLLPETERHSAAARLADAVRRSRHRADFGILGAKYVPRALAENGYAEDALKLFTQREYPGWGYWVEQRMTTLCENWNMTQSCNHIMFGDVSAWMFEFLGGVVPRFDAPGFRRFYYRPCAAHPLRSFSMSYPACGGMIRSAWRQEESTTTYTLDVPPDAVAEIRLPGICRTQGAGHYEFTIEAHRQE